MFIPSTTATATIASSDISVRKHSTSAEFADRPLPRHHAHTLSDEDQQPLAPADLSLSSSTHTTPLKGVAGVDGDTSRAVATPSPPHANALRAAPTAAPALTKSPPVSVTPSDVTVFVSPRPGDGN